MQVQALSVALKSFVKPVHDSLADAQGDAADTLRTLTNSLASTTSCCRNLGALITDVDDPRVLASLTHPLFQPYESFIGDYPRLETVVLSHEVRSAAAPPLDASLWCNPHGVV